MMKNETAAKLLRTFVQQTSITKPGLPTAVEPVRAKYKHYLRFDKVPLKSGHDALTNLQKLIRSRRSRKTFGRRQPAVDLLSVILKSACGTNRKDKATGDYLRSYPSAGARYPLEAYLIVLGEGQIQRGIYHYNVLMNALDVLTLRFDFKRIHEVFAQDFIERTPLILVLTARADRMMSKYGFRGVRYIFLEAGHLCQNLYLLCEEAGLHCCAIGAFTDKELSNLLYLDPKDELPIYAIALG